MSIHIRIPSLNNAPEVNNRRMQAAENVAEVPMARWYSPDTPRGLRSRSSAFQLYSSHLNSLNSTRPFPALIIIIIIVIGWNAIEPSKDR
jgi:hypothetical protein